MAMKEGCPGSGLTVTFGPTNGEPGPFCRVCGKDLGVQGKHQKIEWAPDMRTYVAKRHMRERPCLVCGGGTR